MDNMDNMDVWTYRHFAKNNTQSINYYTYTLYINIINKVRVFFYIIYFVSEKGHMDTKIGAVHIVHIVYIVHMASLCFDATHSCNVGELPNEDEKSLKSGILLRLVICTL